MHEFRKMNLYCLRAFHNTIVHETKWHLDSEVPLKIFFLEAVGVDCRMLIRGLNPSVATIKYLLCSCSCR